MSRIGTVIELRGRYAIISSNRRGICEGCSSQSSCSFDNAWGKSVPELITTINSIQAVPGDHVEFDLPGRTELKLSLIVWIIPLIGLILGAFLGSGLHRWIPLKDDTGTLIGLITGLLLGFGSVVLYERCFINQEKTRPVLLKIIRQNPCDSQKTK